MAQSEQKPLLQHAHQTAPSFIRSLHKHYQKSSAEAIALDPQVLDFTNISELHSKHLRVVKKLPVTHLREIFAAFDAGAGMAQMEGEGIKGTRQTQDVEPADENERLIYEHELLPGLQFVPSLFPLGTQKALLSRLWMRDLSNPLHKTNLHLHYQIPYPNSGTKSFFDYNDPENVSLEPIDPNTHKPLTVVQMMRKKLRWMTLGGQYDWTRKVYPEMDTAAARELPVPFPDDIGKLINSIFPNLEPQAAIANLYSPGDTLSPHRDISEASSAPLASISIGADAIFIIGLSDESEQGNDKVLVMKIRSGDALLMGGESRWAWHSVPKILHTASGTNGDTIEGWPDTVDCTAGSEIWSGWMKNRRVNLNVRQMWD